MSEIYLLIDGIFCYQPTLYIHQGEKYLTHIEIRISSCTRLMKCLLAISTILFYDPCRCRSWSLDWIIYLQLFTHFRKNGANISKVKSK